MIKFSVWKPHALLCLVFRKINLPISLLNTIFWRIRLLKWQWSQIISCISKFYIRLTSATQWAYIRR